MSETQKHKLDLKKIINEQFPGKKIPKFLLFLIKRIAHEKDLNKLFAASPCTGMPFVDGTINYMEIEIETFGVEKLPHDAPPMIFASNHPLGSLDGVSLAHIVGGRYKGKVKIYANEILTILEPIRDMFLPIAKLGAQSREKVKRIQQFFDTDEHLITFPAGATSRKRQGKLIDLQWQKDFVQRAVKHKRDVVPVYFNAQNSRMFYAVEKFRELIRSKVNFEMLMLAGELFKQKGKHYKVYFGDPIPWQTFDKSKSQMEWAEWVKVQAYSLPEVQKITER